MSIANENVAELGSTDQSDRTNFSNDVQKLTADVGKLRDDFTQLLGDALGAGKTAASAARDRAGSAVDQASQCATDLKKKGAQTVESFGRMVMDRPMLTAVVALGVGFILAKLMVRDRD